MMTKEEIMIQMLSQLLEPGETLLCPICGIFGKGKLSRFAYFGFTESHLLMALPVDKQNAQCLRIPLEISALRIKQNKILRRYVIDISFATGASCRIAAYQKVLLLASQEKNFPKFLEYLQSRPTVEPEIDPKTLSGTKLRRQYLIGLIHHILCFMITALAVTFSVCIFQDGNSVLDWMVRIQITHPIWWAPLLILLGLSELNRLFIGKTVCTICQDGLLVDGLLIRWDEIQRIEYEVKSERHALFSATEATVYARSFGEPEYAIRISGFPAFGLRAIRKKHPDITIEINRSALIWMFAIALIVGALVPFAYLFV